MSGSDQQLLELWVHQRDAEAFRTIANRYAGLVYATCHRILGDSTEAQDAAQECFEALAMSGGRPGGYLAPWLHRVATTKSLHRIRSDRNRRRREEAFAPAQHDPVADVVRRDLYSAVDEAIVALPEELRVSIVAHFLEDKTHESIAAELGVSRQTVTYRIGKGIDQIRKQLPVNAAFSVATLADLLKPSVQTPPTLLAGIGKLALAGQVAPLAGLATWMSAKAILTAVAVVCMGGFALLYASRPLPDTESKVPSTLAALSSSPLNAPESSPPPASASSTPAAAATPAATTTVPTPADTSQATAAVPSSAEKTNAAVPADEPKVSSDEPKIPPAPTTFMPYSFLQEIFDKGKVAESCRHFIVSPTVRRTEFTSGGVIIFDLGNRSELRIYDEEKRAVKRVYADDRPAKDFHPIESLLQLAGSAGPKYAGTKNVDGKECNGFRADSPSGDSTLWIDRETGLPVRREGFNKEMGWRIVNSEYDFNMDTSPERFSMKPPEGYEYKEEIIRDTWWSRLTRRASSWWSWLQS